MAIKIETVLDNKYQTIFYTKGMKRKTEGLRVRTKTRQEVACEYGIDRKTLNRWLKRTNLSITNGLICPSEMELIYQTFGNPYMQISHNSSN